MAGRRASMIYERQAKERIRDIAARKGDRIKGEWGIAENTSSHTVNTAARQRRGSKDRCL